jgi:hypothetical protein
MMQYCGDVSERARRRAGELRVILSSTPGSRMDKKELLLVWGEVFGGFSEKGKGSGKGTYVCM